MSAAADSLAIRSSGMALLNSKVLILNRSYLPVHVTSVKRAFALLYQGVARAVDEQYHTFDFDKDTARADRLGNPTINAVDETRLKALFAHGGKLLMYHGWNDPAISPIGTVDYYQQVKQTNTDAQSFVRLFMVPGMQHCYGGPGPSSFGQFGWRSGTGPDDVDHDIYLALEQWVDQGIAPEQVTAAKIEIDEKTGPKITMTRPLCAYPKEPKYKGAGDTSDAKNFECRE